MTCLGWGWSSATEMAVVPSQESARKRLLAKCCSLFCPASKIRRKKSIKKEGRNAVILIAVCLQFYKCFILLLCWFCVCVCKNYVICNRFQIVQGKSIFYQMSVYECFQSVTYFGMNKDCLGRKHEYCLLIKFVRTYQLILQQLSEHEAI